MTDLSELVVKIKADASGLNSGLNSAVDGVKRFSNAMIAQLDKLKYQFLAVGAAVGTIAYKSISEFAQAEKATLRLQAVLKATGDSAGLTAQEIVAIGDSIESTSFFTSEQVQNAASVLATFKSVVGDTYREALPLLADMATVFGSDMSSAAVQLGKALEDPINGINALKRVGVSFSETQKDQIQNFVETNRLAEAQGIILGELASQVGGASAGESSGLAGAFNNLGDAFGNILEDIGEFLAKALNLQGVIEGLTGAVGDFRLGLMQLGLVAKNQQFLSGEMGVIDRQINESMAKIDKLRGMKSGMALSSIEIEGKKIQELQAERARIQLKYDSMGAKYGPNLPAKSSGGESTTLKEVVKTRTEAVKTQEDLTNKTKEYQDAADAAARETERFTGILKDKLSSGLTEAVFAAGNAGDAFKNMALSIAKAIFERNIAEPLAGGILGSVGGGGGLGNILGSISNFLPSFDVGSNYVPRDMMANIHQGEMIIPAAQASAMRSGGSGVTVQQTFTINAGVSAEVRNQVAAAAPVIASAAKDAVFAAIQAGGSAAKIVGVR